MMQKHTLPFTAAPRSYKRPPSLAQQRGITVFIVMAAILVLTGVGTWTLFATALADQASGYSRASAQALFTSEVGILTGSAYLSIPGANSQNYVSAATNPDDCFSVASGQFCKSMHMSDLDPTIQTESTAAQGVARNTLDLSAAGSFSPYASTSQLGVNGDFIIEMTEPKRVLVEGSQAGTESYQRVTLTSYGIIRPGGSATALCTADASYNAIATKMGTRAHMVIGPLSP